MTLHNHGVLGGDISIAAKDALIRKHLSPRAAQVRDLGWPHQCRCGGYRWLCWRKRWYCPTCGRWVRRFRHLSHGTDVCREIGCDCLR